jgi:hypothetical protein
MSGRILSFAAIALLAACGSQDRVSEPIDDIRPVRQKTITRAQLGFEWPLSPGIGTLACPDDGAILFRTGGSHRTSAWTPSPCSSGVAPAARKTPARAACRSASACLAKKRGSSRLKVRSAAGLHWPGI